MILDVCAQVGTCGAHQAVRKPGCCRDVHAGAGVASGGGMVWELGAALGFRRLGRRSWAKPGRGGRERASALLGRAAGPSASVRQATRETKGEWAGGAGWAGQARAGRTTELVGPVWLSYFPFPFSNSLSIYSSIIFTSKSS